MLLQLLLQTLLLLLAHSGDVTEVCLHHDTQLPLLLVSRLDGKISAVSLSPDLPVLWELDLGYPLLSASSVVLGDHTYLIPSLDGNLYTLSQTQVIEPYAQLEALLSKPYDKGSSSRWVGGKVVTTRGVAPKDGRVLYECNFDNCQRYNDSTVGHEPLLAVTDERRTVRLLDMKLGVERWNWSISSVEMQYIGLKHRSSCHPPRLPAKLHFDVEMGVISALFDSGHYATVVLPGPLSQAWVLNDEHLQSVNMFYSDDTDSTSVNVYLGLWQGNHYIQPFHPGETMFRIDRINKEVFELGWTREGRAGRDTISWEHPIKHDSTALAVVSNDLTSSDWVGKIWKPRPDYNAPPPRRESETDSFTVSDVWVSMLSTFLIGIIIAYGVYRKVFKRKPQLTTTSTETEAEDHVSPPSSPFVSNGFNFDNIPPPPFESRFEQDFTVIRDLGQGGFGKVIEAKHKISEHNYAIKIIKLPNKEELRRKVEREVAAMAKLEHPNILRYYTSWKETQTLEWARSRKYTHTSNSESNDSGTSIGTSGHSFSWSKTSTSHKRNLSCNIQIDEESTSIGIRRQSADDTYSDIVFAQDSKNYSVTNGDSSIVFADVSKTRPDLHLSVGEHSVPDSATGDETFSTWNSESENPANSATHESFLYIQMQLCSDQTLKEWLAVNKKRGEIMKIFSEIVDAVEYIHSHNHIHRDLKPSNILFSEDGRVKVADFGLATVMSNIIPSLDSGIDINPGFEGPSMTQNLGTKLYMSPELETDSHYDYKVDIFALGIIFFELLMVFDTMMERVELIQELRTVRTVPSFIDANYPKYKAILLQMINSDPADRPTASDVKAFFSNTDCDQIEFLS
ncbi:eukaryotic translation initiation factor 2-alpha kinase 3-like [Bolinopsis microptera]|uniref:eukaryotic translation initiation factor 2-alpha kinase 3-like n=1 Tax=Bolinopsis microptera TaxID=2820187 RepID=UPI003079B0D8